MTAKRKFFTGAAAAVASLFVADADAGADTAADAVAASSGCC